MPLRRVLEDAVALTVARDVGRGIVANGQRGWRPQFAGDIVAHVENLAGGSKTGSLDHGVSRFSWLFSDQVKPRRLRKP